ncbi:enhanced serine sensitivity protein SseB [Actinoplanes sp. TRM 88003]|uniref:Enhanced serine sensitivity protein SseB n=1 Tax=Paractinoplanes aksuensis TaxID=2939490 RepID=A0ABT1E2Z8_9ACTN|nr:enhanced serine sensitivity protein SseB C-terminal domain-containing protein [Actinoplanes aksuensis]MCO8277509.1 enhanced serine sensitivity protein SseB [Actinoplanes aksuensis]
MFPANPLEEALAGARAGRLAPEQLLQAIAANPLWVPLPAGSGPEGQTQLPVMVLEGRPYVAAYTSAEQYARGAGDQAHMELPGRQLAGLMADELGLAVNPGAELGLPVRADGVRTIRGGVTTVRAGARLRLGQPADEPHALVAALRQVFATAPAVVEARRALAQIGDQAPTLLIGVRPDRTVPTWQQDSINAVRTAAERAPLPYAVDTVFLDDQNDPISRWMVEHTEPLYTNSIAAE